MLLVLCTILIQVYCQDTAMVVEDGKQIISSINDQNVTKVVIGNDLLSFEERQDAINIRVGNRGINILESLEGPKLDFVQYNGDETVFQDNPEESERPARKNYKGHWSGLEFGFNNYLTPEKSMVLPDDIYYMSLHSGKSSNFNINFAQLSLRLISHIGIVTGLGLNFNNYRFEGNNNIIKGANGVIEPYLPPDGSAFAKSKITTSFITVPVLLEIQIPAGDKDHLNIAGGGIMAAKVGSHSKIVYEGSRQKIKDNGDFSLNMLRYGATVRAGYGMLQLYGTYYFTPLFKTGKGPELYPFEVGISFSFEG
jgi:hypothetical protein